MHKYMIDPLNVKIDLIKESPDPILELPIKPVNVADIKRAIENKWLLFAYGRGMIILKPELCKNDTVFKAIESKDGDIINVIPSPLNIFRCGSTTIYVSPTMTGEEVKQWVQEKAAGSDDVTIYDDVHLITGGMEVDYPIRNATICVWTKKTNI